MSRSVRLVVCCVAAIWAFGACKGQSEPAPSNPKPPPPAPAPTQPAPAPAPAPTEQPTPEGEAAQAPAEAETAKVEVSPEAQKEADQLWTTLCSTCHGATGKGDGPVAAGFPTKPADFQDPEFQKTRSDEDLRKVILDGGPAVGKSPLMPPNPNLKDKPEVVQALVNKIRELGKQQ